jgi:hypothetical protein
MITTSQQVKKYLNKVKLRRDALADLPSHALFEMEPALQRQRNPPHRQARAQRATKSPVTFGDALGLNRANASF